MSEQINSLQIIYSAQPNIKLLKNFWKLGIQTIEPSIDTQRCPFTCLSKETINNGEETKHSDNHRTTLDKQAENNTLSKEPSKRELYFPPPQKKTWQGKLMYIKRQQNPHSFALMMVPTWVMKDFKQASKLIGQLRTHKS